MYYKAEIYKDSEIDNYNDDCLPNTGRSFGKIMELKSSDINNLMQEIKDFLNVKEIYNLDNERLYAQSLENSDSYKADNHEIELWKKDEITLYAVSYDIFINEIIVNEFNYESLELEIA